MLGRLPESNAQRPRRGGGFIVSTAVHIVLIAFAVRATALTATPPERPTVTEVHFVPPDPVPRPSAQQSTLRPVAIGRAALPVADPLLVVLPTDVPVTIPEPGSMSRLLEGAFDRTPVSSLGSGGEGAAPNVADGQPLEARHVDRAVMALPGSGSPRYPSMLQSAGIEGDVRAQFVVDTVGRVEPGSVRILESSHESFSQAVRDALARARFVPAEARGRKVRQLVEQPFSFKLTAR
jgi:periplasmic protein TonB